MSAYALYVTPEATRVDGIDCLNRDCIPFGQLPGGHGALEYADFSHGGFIEFRPGVGLASPRYPQAEASSMADVTAPSDPLQIADGIVALIPIPMIDFGIKWRGAEERKGNQSVREIEGSLGPTAGEKNPPIAVLDAPCQDSASPCAPSAGCSLDAAPTTNGVGGLISNDGSPLFCFQRGRGLCRMRMHRKNSFRCQAGGRHKRRSRYIVGTKPVEGEVTMYIPHWLWLLWFLVFVVGGAVVFTVLETIGVENEATDDTLTEVVRGMHLPNFVFFLVGGALIGVIAWGVPHLANKLGF